MHILTKNHATNASNLKKKYSRKKNEFKLKRTSEWHLSFHTISYRLYFLLNTLFHVLGQACILMLVLVRMWVRVLVVELLALLLMHAHACMYVFIENQFYDLKYFRFKIII